jgi:long-chain acyl-CoA synthetase
MDAAGWIHLVDRLKDQINVSGYKVWPREVESALHEHPGVYEAGVTGEPDDYQGERVVAFVALNPGVEVDEAELVAFVGERLAAYKRPRRVHIVDAIPKTLTGKIRRTELRTQSAS